MNITPDLFHDSKWNGDYLKVKIFSHFLCANMLWSP